MHLPMVATRLYGKPNGRIVLYTYPAKLDSDFSELSDLLDCEISPFIPVELTAFEISLLKNRALAYEWMTRTKEGALMWHADRPIKTAQGTWEWSHAVLLPFPDAFKFVKWDDESPCSLEELDISIQIYEGGS